MSFLKITDRIAVAAMFAVIGGVPLATSASFLSRGEPDAKVKMSDGVERRFYTSGPMGTTTFRVDVRADGSALPRVQVLTEESFQAIERGMGSAQVLEMVGPPWGKSRFDATKTTTWDYHYRDGWGSEAEFSVIFDDAGLVVGKVHVRDGN
jgi:SmpA / OmlA family